MEGTPARRAVAEFIYHYHGEHNHQGLGNAFVFLDTTRKVDEARIVPDVAVLCQNSALLK